MMVKGKVLRIRKQRRGERKKSSEEGVRVIAVEERESGGVDVRR